MDYIYVGNLHDFKKLILDLPGVVKRQKVFHEGKLFKLMSSSAFKAYSTTAAHTVVMKTVEMYSVRENAYRTCHTEAILTKNPRMRRSDPLS